MSQPNSLLRLNLSDLVSGKARVKGLALMGGDGLWAEIEDGQSIPCGEGHGGTL